MSLGNALRRLNPDANPSASMQVRGAVQVVMDREAKGLVDEERLATYGHGILHTIKAELDGAMPNYFSQEQHGAFRRATLLVAHTILELSRQWPDKGLDTELRQLSELKEAHDIVADSVQHVTKRRLQTSSTAYLLNSVSSEYPILTMASGELSLHQPHDATFDALDGTHEGIFHYVATAAAVANQQELRDSLRNLEDLG